MKNNNALLPPALTSRPWLPFCLALLTFLGACQSEPEPKKEMAYTKSFRPVQKPEPVATPKARVIHKTWIAGQSVKGRDIKVQSFGAAPKTALIMATIHGNEFAGTPLLKRFSKELKERPELSKDWTIILLPIANPDGYAVKSRRNARGIDLNRNFPASNYKRRSKKDQGPLSEPESRVIEALLKKYKPKFILSFHQAANLLDYDGPGEELAKRLAKVCPLKVSRMGARPGSLGSYAGIELKIPIITVELPGKASFMSEEKLWQNYGQLLLESLKKPS